MKFEYKTLVYENSSGLWWKMDGNDLNSKINELGKDGWELASSFPICEKEGKTQSAVLMFKREARI